MPWGARVLQQLVLQVESLAGAEAVSKLNVVLAIAEDQTASVVGGIVSNKAYGLKLENIVVTVQRKRHAYRYHKASHAFHEDPSTPAAVMGSGFALCQMAWLGDAFVVTPEGTLEGLKQTVLERFAERGVEWLSCRRARDLSLLSRGAGTVADLASLGSTQYMRDRDGADMLVQAVPGQSLASRTSYDSTLLARRISDAEAAAARSLGAGGITLNRATALAAERTLQAQQSLTPTGQLSVVDLRGAELASPQMVAAVSSAKAKSGHGDLWVGLSRYNLHLPTMHSE